MDLSRYTSYAATKLRNNPCATGERSKTKKLSANRHIHVVVHEIRHRLTHAMKCVRALPYFDEPTPVRGGGVRQKKKQTFLSRTPV